MGSCQNHFVLFPCCGRNSGGIRFKELTVDSEHWRQPLSVFSAAKKVFLWQEVGMVQQCFSFHGAVKYFVLGVIFVRKHQMKKLGGYAPIELSSVSSGMESVSTKLKNARTKLEVSNFSWAWHKVNGALLCDLHTWNRSTAQVTRRGSRKIKITFSSARVHSHLHLHQVADHWGHIILVLVLCTSGTSFLSK